MKKTRRTGGYESHSSDVICIDICAWLRGCQYSELRYQYELCKLSCYLPTNQTMQSADDFIQFINVQLRQAI